jgi:hypothetical protein
MYVILALTQGRHSTLPILSDWIPIALDSPFHGRPGASVLTPTRWRRRATKEQAMSLGTILLIVLVLILLGVIPAWPHARTWGYGPSGIVGVILLIVIVLFLMGRL